jgi:CheY-like chemotaxis protein
LTPITGIDILPPPSGEHFMPALPRVLIVDASREQREVLRTLLEHRGATTIEAERPEHAVEMAREFRPDLIVLDAESDQSDTGNPTEKLREAAGRTDTPIVILGKLRHSTGARRPTCESEKTDKPHISSAVLKRPGQFLAKPYHYGALIRKIDDLLAAA